MKDCPILPSRPGSAPAFKTIPLPYWYHLHSHKHPVICLAPSKLAQNDCSLLSIIFKVWLIRSLGPPTCSSVTLSTLFFQGKEAERNMASTQIFLGLSRALSPSLSVSEVPHLCWGSRVCPGSEKEQCFLAVKSLHAYFPRS